MEAPISFPLTTSSGLHNHLTSLGLFVSHVQLLTGGTANFVYRVRFRSGEICVYKHAAPYLYSNRDFSFDVKRMDYEARVLRLFAAMPVGGGGNKGGDGKGVVHAVRVLEYDKQIKLLKLEDGGKENLKEAYTSPELDIGRIGEELGKWLVSLHTSPAKTTLAATQLPNAQDQTPARGISSQDHLQAAEEEEPANNEIAVVIYRFSYNNLHTALSKFGYDTALAHSINEKFGVKLATDDECICHGDFWTGNILLRPSVPCSTTNSAAKPAAGVPYMTVVDWEMTRRGTSATDVAQFAAETYLLDRFKGSRGLRAAFLTSYIQRRGKADADDAAVESGKDVLGREWVARVAVHWAVHIAFWPTVVGWTDEEGTGKLVEIGVKVLRDVLDGDWEGVLRAPVFEGVRDLVREIGCA